MKCSARRKCQHCKEFYLPDRAGLDGGASANEKRSHVSQQLLVARKRPQNRKSSQQNQLFSQDLLTDPFDRVSSAIE
jgi:hypothetical protein